MFSTVALAEDAITSVMSPIVSYQYPDDFSSQALTNGGISSAIVSYQYFEWPGDDVLQLRSSPRVSYFYQGNDGLLILLQGRVTDTSGAPLSGAAISIAFGSLPLTGTTTDANGDYAIPLGAGVYALTASASGHAKSSRVLTLSAGTAAQNFQLTALPSVPSQQSVNRSPTVAYTAGPMGELKVFDRANFVPINFANMPWPDRMTIVLTHGFDSHPEAWATDMAAQMQAQGVTPSVANILCWDWEEAAIGPLTELPVAHGRTGGQGIGLGQALQARLGAGYSKEIHFLGHSLGTLVNAAAANYLQGTNTAHQVVSPTPWMNSPMHMTLFDHAELANVASQQVLFDGIITSPYEAVNRLRQSTTTLHDWASPVPKRFAWLDNYVSLVGFHQSRGVNIALQKGAGAVLPSPVHSYPAAWYGISIMAPSASVLGHRRSHEHDLVRGGPSTFPPSDSDFPPGVSYRQVPSDSDPLVLELLPPGNAFENFGILPQVTVQVTVSTVQFAGDARAVVRDTAEAAVQRMLSGFNHAANIALQGGQVLMNISDSPVLRLLLRTQGIFLPSPMALRDGPLALNAAGGGEPALPPMAWLPIQFPANATAMAFDFMVEGSPMDDVLVCGIGETNLFSLEAKYIPTNTISASRLIDVSAWAGTTNELFFGFMGGTSSNATLIIENIRFYSLTEPRLDISMNGDVSLLSWPSTAGGYVVEATTSLASPAWEALTNAPVISADRYVLTNPWTEQSRFFRLRAR